jgi:hypothetical protein
VITYEVKVEVVGLEFGQGGVQQDLYILGLVMRVPQLAGELRQSQTCLNSKVFVSQSASVTYEDVLAGHTGCLDAITYLPLVVVSGSGVNVSVSGLECVLHGVLDLVGVRLLYFASAGAQSQTCRRIGVAAGRNSPKFPVPRRGW